MRFGPVVAGKDKSEQGQHNCFGRPQWLLKAPLSGHSKVYQTTAALHFTWHTFLTRDVRSWTNSLRRLWRVWSSRAWKANKERGSGSWWLHRRKGDKRIMYVMLYILLTTVSSRPFKSCLVCSWRSCRNLPYTRHRINRLHCGVLILMVAKKQTKRYISYISSYSTFYICMRSFDIWTLTRAPPGARSWCCPDSSVAQSLPEPAPTPAPS